MCSKKYRKTKNNTIICTSFRYKWQFSYVHWFAICSQYTWGKYKQTTEIIIWLLKEINTLDISPILIFQDTKVGSIVFDKFATKDLDSNVNGQVEYIIADPENEFFEIDLPHQGILTLRRELDYETQKIHRVQIIARVRDFFI